MFGKIIIIKRLDFRYYEWHTSKEGEKQPYFLFYGASSINSKPKIADDTSTLSDTANQGRWNF